MLRSRIRADDSIGAYLIMVDKNLLEMARVYRMPALRVIRYIYIPEFVRRFKGILSKEK